MVAKKTIKQTKPEPTPAPVVEQIVPHGTTDTGPKCVECGKPVAEGQNWVCRAHVRST